MRRVVVLGRGGAGKSTFALGLGRRTGLPVVELDQHFWSPALQPLSPDEWREVQRQLAAAPAWIMDGDLGPYDVLGRRLERADTVVVLDLSLARCAWRAVRRSRARRDFWWWVLTWRWRARPVVLRAIATYAATADLWILRSPAQVRAFLASVAGVAGAGGNGCGPGS